MTKDELALKLQNKFGSALEAQASNQPELLFYISREKYHDLCRFLKDDPELDFDFIVILCGVHYPESRFEVVLCLSSHEKKHELIAKVKLDKDNPEIESVCDIWLGASWHERETIELFGINFLNHPDPRPLLLYEGWEYGFPMRKGWTGPDFIPLPEK